MKTSYHIKVNIRTITGMKEIGDYHIGYQNSFASDTFDRLDGDENYFDHPMLRLDLIEVNQNSSTVLKSKACTLEQYVNNCKIVTMEAFKYFTIETGAA